MTNDNGWGRTGAASRSTIPEASDRADIRAAQRDRRAVERAEASQIRAEQRAVEREAQSRLRAAAREERRIQTGRDRSAIAAMDGNGPVERSMQKDHEPFVKRRKSGALARTGEVQKARDTRHYQTVADTDRMRILAKRGASIAGLAAAFGVSIETVEAALAETAFDENGADERATAADDPDLPW